MPRVTVVGAGIGGLACGALLAKAGCDVQVFERNSFVGGRCSATERDGFIIDNFAHAFPMGPKGPHGRLSRKLGEEIHFVLQDPAATVIDAYGGKLNSFHQRLDMRPLWTRFRMARDIGVKPVNFLGGFRLFQNLLRADDSFVEAHDDQTIKGLVLEYTEDENLHRFFNLLSLMFFVLPYDRASAGEFAWCFREMFMNAAFGYVKGSTRAIPTAYLRALEKFGGKLGLGKPVERILSDGGSVGGVLVDGREFPSDVVISDAGIRGTIELAGEEALGGEFVEKADGLEYSHGSLVTKYLLDTPVVDAPYVCYIPDAGQLGDLGRLFENDEVPPDVGLFMVVVDRCDPDCVPPGKQLLIAATLGHNWFGSRAEEGTFRRTDERVFELFPDVEKHLIEKLTARPEDISRASGRTGLGDAIGLAQIPGQVGRNKPSPVTPVEGLYMVGCDAGARGIGTEQAAASAERVAGIVLDRHRA